MAPCHHSKELVGVLGLVFKMKWWAITGHGRSKSCGKKEGIDYKAKAGMPNIYGQL